jgi:hypothetical protein
MLLLLDGLSFEGNFSTCDNLFLTFINDHIGIFYLLLDVIDPSLSSKGLLSQISDVELPDDGVIELIPFIC